MDVVNFDQEHLHDVAALLRAHVSPELERDPARFRAYIDRCYLHPPNRDERVSSLVAIDDDGELVGFCGVTPSSMVRRGESLLLAASGPLVTDPARRAKAPGLFLSRAMLAGQQDLSITDGANDDAVALWLRMGAEVVGLPSMRWIRPLRPTGLALSTAAGRVPMLGSLVGKTALVDRLLMKRFAPGSVITNDSPLDATSLIEVAGRVASDFKLSPSYDPVTVSWKLQGLAEVDVKGTLVARLVSNVDGRPIGWFIYYLVPDGVCRVMQIGCRQRDAAAVVDHLCWHAAQNGGGALFGRFEFHYWDAIKAQPIVVVRNAPRVIIHAADPELRADIHAGKALITRLEGEAWNGIHHQPMP